jgi:asparagine synthase (glutamine-hydrolysing)
MARRHLGRLRAYVADLATPGSEAHRAQVVADHLGVELVRVGLDQERFLRLWPEAVGHDGHACFHRSCVALLAVAKASRADGVKVLLNGEGADELFGGYPAQQRAFEARGWRGRVARALGRLRPPRREPPGFRALGVELLGDRGVACLDGERALRLRALREKLAPLRSEGDRAFLARCLDDLYSCLDPLLRRNDAMAMIGSVEMRVPFLQNDLIDLAIHLPRSAKLRGGVGKWALRQVARGWLPAAIVGASKRAFPVPPSFDAGSESLLLGGAAGELLHWSESTRREMVGIAGRNAALRFLLVGLELWGRQAFRGETPEALAGQLLAAALPRAVRPAPG